MLSGRSLSSPSPLDYKDVFDLIPSMCLILDGSFRIVARNSAHAQATCSATKQLTGRHLFEAFPDNPNDSNAAGVAVLRRSLLNVLKTRNADFIPTLRYDVKCEGRYHARYWCISNMPIVGKDGYVSWILNHAAEVTRQAIYS